MLFFPKIINLKNEMGRIYFLHWLQCSLVVFGLICELIIGEQSWLFVPKIIAILFLYRLYFQLVVELYYSFWTFTFFNAFYIFYGINENLFGDGHALLFFIYLAAMVVLCLECYYLSSPIYFPRVKWWEYDFRYRGDLKVKVEINGEKHNGRLTDLRRNAGCVVLFNELSVGEKFKVITEAVLSTVELEFEVVTKRENSIGRGVTYGVKVITNELDEKRKFENFKKYWRVISSARIQAKFRGMNK